MAEKLATISYVNSLLGTSGNSDGRVYQLPAYVPCVSSASYSANLAKGYPVYYLRGPYAHNNYSNTYEFKAWIPYTQIGNRMYYTSTDPNYKFCMWGGGGEGYWIEPFIYSLHLLSDGLICSSCWVPKNGLTMFRNDADSGGSSDDYSYFSDIFLANGRFNGTNYITSSISLPLSANEDEESPIKITRYDDHVLDPCTGEYYIKSPVLIVKEYADGREEEEWIDVSVLDGDSEQKENNEEIIIDGQIDSSIGDSSTSNVQQP